MKLSNHLVDVYGVKVLIKSDDSDFLQFVKENYPCFIKSFNEESVNLKVEFSKKAGIQARKNKDEMVKMGEGLFRGEADFYWENEFGFSVCVKMFGDDNWVIKGFHFDLLEKRENEEVLKNYQRSMRWMIHFPIFSMLDNFQGKRLVHASSISKNGKAIVLAGLNKVGKSSLGRYLFEKEDFKYIADNFLLTDGEKVFAFPERGRLSQDAIKALGLDANGKEIVYGKHHYQFAEEEIEKEAKSEAIFIVGNEKDLTIQAINNETGNKTLEGMHRYLKEFPEYTFFSVLDSFDFWERSKQPLFNKNIPFYRLNYPLDWSLDKTAKEILKCTSIT